TGDHHSGSAVHQQLRYGQPNSVAATRDHRVLPAVPTNVRIHSVSSFTRSTVHVIFPVIPVGKILPRWKARNCAVDAGRRECSAVEIKLRVGGRRGRAGIATQRDPAT